MHNLFTVYAEQVRSPYIEHAEGGLPNPTHIMFSSSISLVNFDGITKAFTFLFPFFCGDFGVSSLLFDGVFCGVTGGVFLGETQ